VRIINRYVLREHLGPLVFAMSALTSLLLLNYIAKQLPHLVGKGLEWTVIAEFVLLSLPFTIAMTLPMAVLVATLHAFSRLASDSEITACKASGLALPRLMAPVIVVGLMLSLLMVWFNDQVMPAANWRLQTLSNDIARKKPTFALRPQVINEVSKGRLFLSAGRLVGGSSEMRDVTIYDLSGGTRRRTIRADSGHVELSADGRDLLLTLFDGYMIEVNSSEPLRLQRVFFTRDFVRVKGIGNDLERNTTGGHKSDRESTVCELQGQLRAAIKERDSLYAMVQKLDPPTARTIGVRPVAASSGVAYCGFLKMILPSEARAQAAQVGAVVQKPESTRAVAAESTQAVIPPSAGVRLPEPKVSDDLAPPIGLTLEGLKLQIKQAQRVINGNQVEIEKKFAIATACVIFALLGAPVAFRFPRGGVGMTIGVSLAVFGVYYIGLLGGEELARQGMLPAFVAMWGTNAILLVIGLVLTARLGNEGTTHRGSELTDWVARAMERMQARLGRKRAEA
jgi:lipopolysaccharide export system permease protein